MGERTDRAFILRWLDAGAHGYVPTSADPAQVDCAIRTVLFGGVYMPSSVAAPVAIDADARADRSSDAKLTARQRQVFELLLLGMSTKQIARRLDLAVATVSIHLAAIFRAFGAHSRSEVVVKALFAQPPHAGDAWFRHQAS
jgi:DNA-binding NarL/FixJ family response regulator